MAHLTDHHFPSYELNLVRQTDGSKPWQQIYGMPQIGACLWYSALGNSEYLGESYAVVPFINFPLFQNPHFRFAYRFGIGLGWLTKSFDINSDYRNTAIGSKLNAAIKMNFEAEWYYRHFIFSSGLGFTHMSDGAFSFPNLGINIATVNVGAAYKFGFPVSSFQFPVSKKEFPFQRNSYLYIIANFGVKKVSPPGSKPFPVYDVCGEYLKRVSLKSEFGCGLEIAYDLSNVSILKQLGDTLAQSLQAVKPGIFLAYQLNISKLKLQFNLGRYIYAKYHAEGYVYNRIILRYPLTDRLLINLSLKSNNFKADVTEFGICYRMK